MTRAELVAYVHGDKTGSSEAASAVRELLVDFEKQAKRLRNLIDRETRIMESELELKCMKADCRSWEREVVRLRGIVQECSPMQEF